MTDTYPAFDISPVPVPTTDAAPPEQFRGLYGMPMFVSIPTSDLAESVDFWIRGLGFFDLFSVPDRLTHLRRWAFQDVLLVPGERADSPPSVSVSFACVLSQIGQIANACEELRAGCTSGPHVKPWNSLELEIVTPENARVIMTAARPYDPNSAEAEYLRGMGIDGPGD
ncbi:VOC family protein [Rhodococcus sp. IC4_135]|uniref:VOC family protein n=1 Tax=Rhodococcus sp. IC4_135 TaxID=2715537 RepID=UPI0014234BB7|nr:VOC family protein [Rhodococcus sp. IC4_135]